MNDEIDISNSCFYIGDCSEYGCKDMCPYYDDYDEKEEISCDKRN